MAQQLLQLFQAHAAHDRPGRERVPERVEVDVIEFRVGDSALVSLPNALGARTEGNPFFLEESVQGLVETKALVGERGAYCLAGPVQNLQLPATAQAILATRIDRLSADDKRLLQAAAVVGKDVPLVLLQAIAEEGEEQLHGGLARLQAAEFLYEARLFPEVEYTFKHVLTHEVAYGSLLQERRRGLHARIAEEIERLYHGRIDEQVEQLAHHFRRGEVWDKAVAYLRQAGSKAPDRGGHLEAAACFEQGLTVLKQLPESSEPLEKIADFLLYLATSRMPHAKVGRVGELLREAQGLAEKLGDQRRLGRVSSVMTLQSWMTGNPQEAIGHADRALTIAATLGDFALKVRTSLFLGEAYWVLGRYRQAIEVLASTAASLNGELLHRRLGMDYIASVVILSWLASSHAALGEFQEAADAAEESVRIAEAANSLGSLAEASQGLGFVCLWKGEYTQAIPLLERGLELCRVAIPLYEPLISSQLGYSHILTGRVHHGLHLLEQAVEQGDALGLSCNSLLMVWLSEAYLLDGRTDDANRLGRRALDLAQANTERGHEAYALRMLARIAADTAPFDASTAVNRYEQATELAGTLGMRPLVAHCHLGLGKLYRRTGKREQAREHFTTAAALYREMGMTYWLEQAEAELVRASG